MDSSFDLFLPNKISKKALVSAKSQDNKPSKVNDFERAISLSLRETSSSISLVNPVRGKYQKLGGVPLLLRRSKADRHKIISEKVALVLASSVEDVDRESFLQFNGDVKLKSESLNDCLNLEASLWKLSQLSSSEQVTTETFTLGIISKYEESGSQMTKSDSLDTQGAMDDSPGTTVSQDNFGARSSDPSNCLDVDDRPSNRNDLSGDSRDGPSMSPQANSDVSTLPPYGSDVELDDDLLNVDTEPMAVPRFETLGSQISDIERRKRKFVDYSPKKSDPSDVIIIEDSGNSSEGHEMSLKLTLSCESDSGDTVPPSYERDSELPNSEWSSIDETRVLNKLSEELEGLIRVTDSYMVHIYLKDDNKFKAASNIMEVRCPLLLKEAKDRVIMWPKVNSCTCEAFFTYLYSGSLSRVRNLSSEDLWLVDSLCVKYEVDLLHKFIKSLTPRGEMSSHENSDLEIINTSVTQLSQSPGSPDLFDNEIEPDGMPKHSVGFVCISSQSNSPSHIEPPPSPPIIVTASTSNAHSSRCQTNSTISPLVKDCQTPHGQRIVSSEATPMPNYHSLLTPELKRELDKYGLKKGLDRKKAINLLSYIYEQIHPHKRDPIVQRAIIETQERLLRAGETDTDSASSSDSFASTSEEPSDNEPDEVVAMTIDDRDRVLRRISRFIKENEEFHVAILKYEPIQLEKLRASLKENAVPHSKPVLKFVLDELGIDYTTENNEDNNSRKRRRKQRKC